MPTPSDSRQPSPRPDRRALGEIFGELLPDATADERASDGDGRGDDWYLSNRPPHHDRDP